MSSYVKELNVNPTKKLKGEELKRANEKCEAARMEDARLVKGTFKNLEAPGGDLEFGYRAHRGEPIRIYYFKDGQTYDVPLGVAKHINNRTKAAIHSHLLGADGKPIGTRHGAYRQRYQFLSAEFM